MSSRGDGQKPDVRNLAYTQAHAPLPLPAGHARMPPGPSRTVTELYMQGFRRPASRLSREAGSHCSTVPNRQAEYERIECCSDSAMTAATAEHCHLPVILAVEKGVPDGAHEGGGGILLSVGRARLYARWALECHGPIPGAGRY